MNVDDLQFAVASADHTPSITAFDCGPEPWATDVRDFLCDDAIGNQTARLGMTYLFFLANASESRLVGFVTLLASEVRRKDWSLLEVLKREDIDYPSVPAVLIGQLGVDVSFQGTGAGKAILAWVRSMTTDLNIGARLLAVHVNVKNARATAFYERESFEKAPVKAGRNLQLMLFDLRVSEGSAKPSERV